MGFCAWEHDYVYFYGCSMKSPRQMFHCETIKFILNLVGNLFSGNRQQQRSNSNKCSIEPGPSPLGPHPHYYILINSATHTPGIHKRKVWKPCWTLFSLKTLGQQLSERQHSQPHADWVLSITTEPPLIRQAPTT